MSDKKLSIRKLKNTAFPQLYSKFMVGENITAQELTSLLSVAVYMINLENELFHHLGYRIIVEYCNRYKNYRPLYDLAVNYGLYPISKFINNHYVEQDEKTFFSEWNDAFTEQFRKGGIYQTYQQSELDEFIIGNNKENVTVVAPTSYGKSELIIEIVRQYRDGKICVITSTKALLLQTKKRIKDSDVAVGQKIIVHPEMYQSGDNSCIAVLTQERLLRLLKKDMELGFDCIVIDEAHELLENNERSNMLASVLIVAKKRNPEVAFKFLTPFVASPDNLKPRYIAYDLKSYMVNEYLKSEKYLVHDIKRGTGTYLYDQFLNEFYKIGADDTGKYEEQIVFEYSGKKNIIYLNKPQSIEEFALALSGILPEINDDKLTTACRNIAEYLNPGYNMITCLRHGVIYHHGSVPDAMRIYAEYLYKTVPEIKFVVTSSTLLAGVNLPADRMFILDNKKGRRSLRPESFKNLVGRACRFGGVFSEQYDGLLLLEPEIHIVYGKYFSNRANYETFLRSVARADQEIEDRVDNVLLNNTKVTEQNKKDLDAAREFIENYENGAIPEYTERYTSTDVGRYTILNGIREIDIFSHEFEMQDYVEGLKTRQRLIDKTDDLMNCIKELFIKYIPRENHENIQRLMNDEARKFYAMLLDWRMGNKAYAEMIQLFIGYWRNLYQNNRNAYIYVGRWGDEDINGSHGCPYTYLRNKNMRDVVNLAIVRIKEEQDFIDNTLVRFIEVLNDLKLLEEHFYSFVKYGTDDERIICLLKNGTSLSLATLLISKYNGQITLDIYNSVVTYDANLVTLMEDNNENQILIHELKNCI